MLNDQAADRSLAADHPRVRELGARDIPEESLLLRSDAVHDGIHPSDWMTTFALVVVWQIPQPPHGAVLDVDDEHPLLAARRLLAEHVRVRSGRNEAIAARSMKRERCRVWIALHDRNVIDLVGVAAVAVVPLSDLHLQPVAAGDRASAQAGVEKSLAKIRKDFEFRLPPAGGG